MKGRLVLALGMLACSAPATDSKVCAQCHVDIARRYSLTPMARTTAMVDNRNAPVTGREFRDEIGGTRFRLSHKLDSTVLHFSREGAEAERPLTIAIGAGTIGRSYASAIGGFLFQAPVSYYTAAGAWDLSPGFEGSERLNITRPMEPACLNCHASRLRTVAGTVNGYGTPVFEEAGVSCERCHGRGEAHVALMKSGSAAHGSGIVNPAKLPPAERDSVCAQCHLVSVIRIAKTVSAYEPGKRLFDSTSAFLWSSGARPAGANSHYEQLVSSACWRGSAGKLWCGTCHNPHGGAPGRERCLSCHTVSAPACSKPALQREAVKDDCVRCHMPSRPIATVQHGAQVDHTISRVPMSGAGTVVPADAELVPFPGSTAGKRELGLAYASEALPKNNRAWGMRAFTLLGEAAAANPEDAAVAAQLGQLYDRMGNEARACELFSHARTSGAAGTAALVNLGACQAKRGELDEAIRSWTEALARNPALEGARLNLAVALYRTGRSESALANVRIALEYDPFSQPARDALRAMLNP